MVQVLRKGCNKGCILALRIQASFASRAVALAAQIASGANDGWMSRARSK